MPMERYRTTKSQNGGARKGAGRPPGSTNRLSKAIIEIVKATGKLPTQVMLEWVQTGLMERPIAAYEIRSRVSRDGKGMEQYRVEIPKRDEAGNVMTEYVVIDDALRAHIAIQVAPYFTPRLSSSVLPKPDAEGNYQSSVRANADYVVDKLMAPVNALPSPTVTTKTDESGETVTITYEDDKPERLN